jgi:Leucine-rich repeat (LRR) protein
VELYSLVNLEVLHVTHNKIGSIQPEISNLVGLKVLDLQGNELKDLPSTLSQMPLRVLNINWNLFEKIPEYVPKTVQTISSLAMLKRNSKAKA